jgi:hypothetical protein
MARHASTHMRVTVLAMYQHSRPAPSHTEAFVAVDGYEEPKTVDEARALILKLGARRARGEISVIAHDALINGLKAYDENRRFHLSHPPPPKNRCLAVG